MSSLLLQLFAHRGYGVLELDNRGSANRGREFEAALYKHMGSIEVEDQVLGTQICRTRHGQTQSGSVYLVTVTAAT